MTDRINTLTVVLEQPIREDNIQHIMEAISMIRYVEKVELGHIDNPDVYIAQLRADTTWRKELLELLERRK